MRAANGNGEGPWSASATLKAGLPGPPLLLWAEPKGGQLEVSWLRNLDDGATLVTDYDIRYRESGQSTWIDWKPNETSTERVHMVTGLTNGTTYDVQARAENVYGAGPLDRDRQPRIRARPTCPTFTGRSSTTGTSS